MNVRTKRALSLLLALLSILALLPGAALASEEAFIEAEEESTSSVAAEGGDG